MKISQKPQETPRDGIFSVWSCLSEKKAPSQVFFYDVCEIFQNNSFKELLKEYLIKQKVKVGVHINFIRKETLKQVFSLKFCDIFQHVFDRIPLVGIPEKWDRDLWPQYDQVGPGTRDPPGETRDLRTKNFQVGPWDPWSGSLMNNLVAWKFWCCNKSIDIDILLGN